MSGKYSHVGTAEHIDYYKYFFPCTVPAVLHQGNSKFLHQQKISLQMDKWSSSWYMDRHSKPPLLLLVPLWEG